MNVEDSTRQDYVRVLKHRIRELTHIIGAQGEICDTLRPGINDILDGKADTGPVKDTIRMYKSLALDQAKLCDDLMEAIDRYELNGGTFND
jgi:hypothetical protein